MGSTALTQNVVGIDEKVKAAAGDATPGYLDAKVDASTITVTGNQLVRAALTGGVTTVGNAATVVTNANLTGGVTSVGNAATVVTNANLTGIVTSTGNATAIADGAVSYTKLANGTDGELLTWNASGVIAPVPVGTATHVLTSNGAGAAPTFQAASGGGDFTLTSQTTGTATNTGDITIAANKLYHVNVSIRSNGATSPDANLRFNSLSTSIYLWNRQESEIGVLAPVEVVTGSNTTATEIPLISSGLDGTDGWVRGHFTIDTRLHDTNVDYSAFVQSHMMFRDGANDLWSNEVFAVVSTNITITSFELDFGGDSGIYDIRVYEITT